MPEQEKNNFDLSKLSSLMSMSLNEFKEEFKYDEIRAENLYCTISSEIIQAISTANIEDFKKLLELIERIKINGEEFHWNFLRSTDKSLASSNFLILSCKCSQVSILEYLFNNPSVINFISDGNNSVKLNDVDSDNHNAFYYAIRSGNCKLVETLVKKCPRKHFQVTTADLDEFLAQSYEELKLKCVALTDEIEVLVESLIIDHRFHSDSSSRKDIKISHGHINQRIDLVIDNIKLLLREYSAANLNAKFFYIVRFIAQNINILKCQLKSTYSKLPWEEMEFCLIAFVSNERKYQTHRKGIKNFFLSKKKLFEYLRKFAVVLGIAKHHINKTDIAKLAILPDNQREEIVSLIITDNPQLTGLYNDYRDLRDTHSLEVINEYLNLASSINPKEHEGQLIIIRALQVMGEYMKNTLKSPKMSSIISDLLLSSLPSNTRKLITGLRNSLSHAFSQSQRLQLEENFDDIFFINVQQDIKVMNKVIVNILYQVRYQHIEKILKRIIDCKSNDQVCDVLETFDCDYENWIDNNKVNSKQQIMEWIEELNSLLFEDDIDGKNLLDEVRNLITTKLMPKVNELDYKIKMKIIENLRKNMNQKYTDRNSVRASHFWSKELLMSINFNKEENIKMINMSCSNIFQTIHSKIPLDNSIKAWGLITKIMYNLGCNLSSMKWMEEFRDKLREKKVQNFKHKRPRNNLSVRISALRSIFGQIDFFSYKSNEKLQVVVEMLVLDVLSILNDSKNFILKGDELFLDNYSAVLIGKNLRNHLAHDNDIIKILPFDSRIAVFLNVKKCIENIIGSNLKIGKITEHSLGKLTTKYQKDLRIIDYQEEMFCALEEGNFEKLTETLKKGADIYGKNIRSWTAIHFAAKGPSIVVVKFVLDQNVDLKTTNDSGETPLHIAAGHGRTSIIELLIKNGCDVNAKDTSGQSVLHKAVESGCEETVRLLIKNKANTDKKNQFGYAPLHCAVVSNHKNVVEILLRQERHVDFNEASGGFTSLFLAAEYGHTELVEYLLKRNANVDAKTHQEATPILSAAINGHLEVVKILISYGAKVNHISITNGISALRNAVETNREEIAEFLLQHGADVNLQGQADTHPPIYCAAEKGFVNLLKLLLKYNARVNISSIDGKTPLHYAALHGHVDILNILIENKGVIDAKTVTNDTPLHFASSEGHWNAVEFLIRKGASHKVKNFKGMEPLHVAAFFGREKCLQVFIENGAHVDAKNDKGVTALHLSSRRGHVEATKLLISKGADLNVTDSDGSTPLHIAATFNKVETIEVLINAGANISLLNNFRRSALELGIMEGHIKVVRYYFDKNLLSGNEEVKSNLLITALNTNNQEIAKIIIKNTSINIKGEQGTKLLRNAARNNQVDIVKKLLALGVPVKFGADEAILLALTNGHKNVIRALISHGNININEKLEGNQTLLHTAVLLNHKNIVELLLAKGANVSAVTSDDLSALHLAASEGYFNIIKLLLSKGADLGLKDIKNRTALELALKNTHNHIESFKILFEARKIDVNYRFNNEKDWTLLHVSAQEGSLPLSEYLIEKGADIHLTTKTGSKPIHVAALGGHKLLVEYYLDKNIDMYDQNKVNGCTLLHYAVHGNKKNVVNYLISKKFDVNVVNVKLQTPLHEASFLGHYDIVRILLNNGAIYNIVDDRSIKPSEIAQNLEIDKVFDCVGRLFAAVKENDIHKVKRCIDEKVVINAINTDHVTALHYAAWKGFTEIARILLSNEANPNIFNKNGSTPLHFAAKFGHPGIVRLLLNNGAMYNSKTNKNNTPLKLATNQKIIELLQLINRSFIYVKNGNSKVIKDLRNADCLETVKTVMNSRNSDGKRLMVVAIHEKFNKIDDLKDICLGSSISAVDDMAIREKYQEALQQYCSMLQRGLKVLSSDDPLILEIEYHKAFIIYKQQSYQKTLDVATKIYDKQKDILGTNDNNTLKTNCLMAMALHRLGKNDEALILFQDIYEKQSRILKTDDRDLVTTQVQMGLVLMNLKKYDEALFFYKNALEKTLNTWGITNALVIQNNIAMVYTLQGKYIEAINYYEEVYELRKHLLGPNNSDTLRALFNKIGVLFKQEKYNDALTAFKKLLVIQNEVLGLYHIDTLMTKLRIGDIYFQQGRMVDALKIYTDIDQPLVTILGLDHMEIKVLKIRLEGITQAYQCCNENILKYCQNNEEIREAVKSEESIKILLSSDVNINSKDNNGLTSLHYAVNNQNENVVRFLLKNNADCCLLTGKGNSALHVAVVKNNTGLVCALLEHAKSILESCKLHDFINAKTTNGGMTSLHVAAQKGFEDIVEILLKYGAVYNSLNYTEGSTPYDLCNNDNIRQLLKLIDEIFVGAEKGNNGIITKLKKLDITKQLAVLNTRNLASETLIKVALSNNHENLARKLLEFLTSSH